MVPYWPSGETITSAQDPAQRIWRPLWPQSHILGMSTLCRWTAGQNFSLFWLKGGQYPGSHITWVKQAPDSSSRHRCRQWICWRPGWWHHLTSFKLAVPVASLKDNNLKCTWRINVSKMPGSRLTNVKPWPKRRAEPVVSLLYSRGHTGWWSNCRWRIIARMNLHHQFERDQLAVRRRRKAWVANACKDSFKFAINHGMAAKMNYDIAFYVPLRFTCSQRGYQKFRML